MKKKDGNLRRSLFVPEGQPVTAFNIDEKGFAKMDTFDGLAQKNSRTWQLIAICSMIAFFLSIAVLVWAVHQPKTVPVIVTVNGEGNANYIGKVDKSLYGSNKIPEIHKIAQIKNLVTSMFTQVIDEEAQQNYINQAGCLVQGGAATQLNDFFTAHNPFQTMGSYVSAVSVEEPLKQSEKTFIVYFNVKVSTYAGYVISNKRYSMLVTIDYFNMTLENPLGGYITNFDLKEVEKNRKY